LVTLVMWCGGMQAISWPESSTQTLQRMVKFVLILSRKIGSPPLVFAMFFW
jgi:hypothetical protein